MSRLFELKYSSVAHLSNFEVYRFVKEEQRLTTGRNGLTMPGCLATVLYGVSKYLEQQGTSALLEPDLTFVIEKLAAYKLTKKEVLQIINCRPTTPVELQLIIENMESRFNDEEVNNVLRLLKERL